MTDARSFTIWENPPGFWYATCETGELDVMRQGWHDVHRLQQQWVATAAWADLDTEAAFLAQYGEPPGPSPDGEGAPSDHLGVNDQALPHLSNAQYDEPAKQ